ncbi:MAG: DEAD/DEAH box helicase [Anaerolineae bacterium]|nr:DEAD/DEAH box helicase [Anaerolineae bacterium]
MNASELKSRLPRTWGAFFGRYGNFTPIQNAAIPMLLAGENVVLCAATASGKTEAALAPMIEQHLLPVRNAGLRLLYLLPTRALINDLAARLAAPLEVLRLSLAIKTRDLDTFDPKHPANVLLTTPESLDSLLASEARALIQVRAIVIDELHGFDGTVRGDQLRVLLNRLRQVRIHAARTGDASEAAIQYAALSATLPQPDEVAARYFPTARILQIPSRRTIHLETVALSPDSPDALLDSLDTFRQRGWRKAIAFCNTRAEVEAYAAAVRAAGSPFGDAVYVHYSNLERERRREIEVQFAHAEAALCFASSTLELGIDIGSIDVVFLIGAPGNAAAFSQRIGRANRRQAFTRGICFYRTPLESLLFDTLLHAPDSLGAAAFRPSTAIQQIFSLLRQSPTGAVRLKPLSDLFDGMLSAADLEAILGQLQASGYLNAGRAGEWRPGERLNRLVDLQALENAPLSLYSNIQTDGATKIKIRDQHTQRVVASVDRQWLDRDVLTLEGRPLNVEWVDDEALWVSAYRGEQPAHSLYFRSARQVLSCDLAQQLPAQLGLNAGEAPLVPLENGWLWFHWLGDVYGRALLDLLRSVLPAEETPQPGLCVFLSEEPHSLPAWTTTQITRYLSDQYRGYEQWLALGAYQRFLPLELRRRAVVDQFDAPRFVGAINNLKIVQSIDRLTQSLQDLVFPSIM